MNFWDKDAQVTFFGINFQEKLLFWSVNCTITVLSLWNSKFFRHSNVGKD